LELTNLPVVLVTRGQVGEGCRAIAAFVRPISGVGVHVACQLLSLGEAMTTDPEK